MELICPSCEARYQVPDSSVGEKGRQVSCMNCGHGWHAFPPLILGSAAAPAAGTGRQAAPGGAASPAHGRADGGADGGALGTGSGGAAATAASAFASDRPRVPEPSRSEQLAEIREMLAEVQSEDRAAAAIAPDDDDRTRIPSGAGADRRAALGAAHAGAPDEPARPVPSGTAHPAGQTASDSPAPGGRAAAASPARVAAAEDADEEEEDTAVDPLRRRMALHQKQGERARGTDVDRLRRRHDRRARRARRARETGSGAFLTGFLLIVMIAAVMTALYILAPQIAERMPGTEAMLAEYVQTIDGLRVSVEEGFATARDWVMKQVEKV